MQQVKEQIDNKLSDPTLIIELYRQFLGEPVRQSDKEFKFLSPFASEKTPSFGVDPNRLGMYKCFSSGNKGNIYTFLKSQGVDRPLLWLADRLNVRIDKEKVDMRPKLIIEKSETLAAHKALMANPVLQNKLIARGFAPEYILKRRVGYDNGRYWIPILDEEGDVVNIRMYDPESKIPGMKVISFWKMIDSTNLNEMNRAYLSKEQVEAIQSGGKVKLTGFGKGRLFPVENLLEDTIYILEGERDQANAERLGLNAVTVTGGAMTWDSGWNKLFAGKKVIIVPDNDKPGFEGAKKKADNLSAIADVKIVKLPLEQEHEDFTDYVTKYKGTKESFLELVNKETTIPTLLPQKNDKNITMKDPKSVHDFAVAIQERYDLCYVKDKGFYLYEATGIWRPVHDLDIEALILGLYRQYTDKITPTKIQQTFKLIQIDSANKILKSDNNMLNFVNGLYDIKQKKLFPHTKDVFTTRQFPYPFDPTATCPRWEKFLEEVFPNDVQNSGNIAQEMFGYCLTTDVLFQKAFLLIGSGSNGKSVFINILEEIVGRENRSAIAFSQLNNSFSRSMLYNKLLNVSSEVDFNNVTASGVFKQIVTGDSITAQEKYKPEFSFNPFCKLVFATNELIVTKDKTHGYFRRWIMLSFSRTFTEKEADRGLTAKLKTEGPGIINWALRGYERLYTQNRFTESAVAESKVKEYKELSSPLLIFVSECCTLCNSTGEKVERSKFIEEYRKYCIANSYLPMATQRVSRDLKENCGIESIKTRGVYYYTGVIMGELDGSIENTLTDLKF